MAAIGKIPKKQRGIGILKIMDFLQWNGQMLKEPDAAEPGALPLLSKVPGIFSALISLFGYPACTVLFSNINEKSGG